MLAVAPFLLSLCAVVCACAPGIALYLGMGLGIWTAVWAVITYRNRSLPGWARLSAAAALSLSCLAVLLTSARYAASWVVINKLDGLFA